MSQLSKEYRVWRFKAAAHALMLIAFFGLLLVIAVIAGPG